MLVETINTSNLELQELFGCEVIVLEEKIEQLPKQLINNLELHPTLTEDYTTYVDIYRSYSYQVDTAIKQFDEIARMQCMCGNHNGVVYDASLNSLVNTLNFNPLKEEHDHEHGHCSKHPNAHFKKGEKCPFCT